MNRVIKNVIMIGGRTKFLFLSMMMAVSTNVAVNAHSISKVEIQKVGPQKIAAACILQIGRASGGQMISLNICRIYTNKWGQKFFTYYFGTETVESHADCKANTWTTYPERQEHSPQSFTTQKMMSMVCSR